jgi:predicted DNA-binding transcriptional regulator AlpA
MLAWLAWFFGVITHAFIVHAFVFPVPFLVHVAAAVIVTPGLVFLRINDVCAKVGLKKSSILEKVADGLFPKPVRITIDENARRGTSVWVAAEVDCWMQQLIDKRDQELKNPRPRLRDNDGVFLTDEGTRKQAPLKTPTSTNLPSP